MLNKIYEFLFYNPVKVAKYTNGITVDPSAILLKPTRFRIQSDENVVNIQKILWLLAILFLSRIR